MGKYGPALVIVAETHEDFNESNRFKYQGVPKGKHAGHAMVLVGIRKDDANQTFFSPAKFLEGQTVC